MSISVFTPSAYDLMPALQGESSTRALPGGTGTALVVANLGPYPAVVLLGDSSVEVTPATGMAVLPNQSIALAVGTNTHIAAIGTEGLGVLNLAQGA